MACGMGACYACVVHLKNAQEAANKRVCEDGPVLKLVTSSYKEVLCQKIV